MDKLIKFFPFMPTEKDGGKLALAILFYVFVPSIAGGILSVVCTITVILSPVALLLPLVALAYTVMGIVFAIMCFNGKDFSQPADNDFADNDFIE